MRVLVATDAWHPQVNGVVRTLSATAEMGKQLGADFFFLTPANFRSLPLSNYPEISVAFPSLRKIKRLIAEIKPNAIHIATEGPIGLVVRYYCRRRKIPFTTSFHTRFPEYVSARCPIPESWVWAYLRWFHSASGRVMAATSASVAELNARKFEHVVQWSRGVDTNLFRPRPDADLGLPRPVFLAVGRVAVEKNLETFLALDLPGTKVVVGDGPARDALSKKYPGAVFLGLQQGEELARTYAAGDAFVFPSRTDTFGLVLLEALASGLPVAAFPVEGVQAVMGSAPVCILDEDLRAACLRALDLSSAECRNFAQGWSWENSTRRFLGHAVRLPAAIMSDLTFEFEPKTFSANAPEQA
jgi:glycosyltransferase involved in cell wall biosynthesis